MTRREDETGEHSFDELARRVAEGTISRGKALKAVFGGLLGGLLSLFALPPREAEARQLKTLWAVVRSDGTLVSEKGVTFCARTAFGRPSGDYTLHFNRNISLCAKTATIGDPAGGTPASGEIVLSHGGESGVQVLTQNSSGAALDQPFSLVVNC